MSFKKEPISIFHNIVSGIDLTVNGGIKSLGQITRAHKARQSSRHWELNGAAFLLQPGIEYATHKFCIWIRLTYWLLRICIFFGFQWMYGLTWFCFYVRNVLYALLLRSWDLSSVYELTVLLLFWIGKMLVGSIPIRS